MAKRLTPERYEILRAHLPLEVVQHIEALAAMVDDAAGGLVRASEVIVKLQDELAEAKAVVADKAMVLERYAAQKDELNEARATIARLEAEVRHWDPH